MTGQFIHLFNAPNISLSGWSVLWLQQGREGAVPRANCFGDCWQCQVLLPQPLPWDGVPGAKWESFQVKCGAQPHNQISKYTGVYLGRWTFSKLKKCFRKVINGIKANSLNSLKLGLCDICISAKIRSFFSFWRDRHKDTLKLTLKHNTEGKHRTQAGQVDSWIICIHKSKIQNTEPRKTDYLEKDCPVTSIYNCGSTTGKANWSWFHIIQSK